MWHFLDELLYLYGSEYFIASRIGITRLLHGPQVRNIEDATDLGFEVQNDLGDSFEITAIVEGEKFDQKRHSQGNWLITNICVLVDTGTEVKAITMHDMLMERTVNSVRLEILLDI